MKISGRFFLFTCLLLAASSARAHVVLAEPVATAGSSYRATFKVGHGCGGSATSTLLIVLPDDVVAAKPMPKPGWTLDVQRKKLAVPYDSHGKSMTEGVYAIAWRGGRLPDAHYDEFVVQLRLPDTPGKRYFKTTQICEKGRLEWNAVPGDEKPLPDSAGPAPVLDVQRLER